MKRNCILVVLMVSALACKKPYTPPEIKSPYNYLVVQGIINSGPDSTIINLSRTVNISSNTTFNPELHATLTVESDNNSSYPLSETQNGNYVSPGLNLDITRQYRLRIKTAGNVQYLSDFVPVKITPPIDSIGFNITATPDTGVNIYVNTHDASNNTRYYRWDYNEDWQFHAYYLSILDFGPGGIESRPPDQYIYFCYQKNISSNIVLGSTAKLAKDVVYQNPVVFIAAGSEKIETKYSILLKQYALTPDAFTFWQSLKKNSEQLGSIFDAEPSQNTGNIRNLTNPDEPALGYISAGTVQSKRIFISSTQLPNWTPAYPYACGLDSVDYPGGVPVTLKRGTFKNPISIYYSDPGCVDCTIRGSITPPPFWPK